MKNYLHSHYSLIICSLFIALSVLPSCKKDSEWLDWRVQNEAWMTMNGQKEGVITTPTGLQYRVIREGVGSTKPDNLKTVVVNYTGSLINGNQFDSATEARLGVSTVVQGFAEGLRKMRKSGHYILYVPHNLGYKDEEKQSIGNKGHIPPYSTLIFDVTLVDVYY